MRRGQTPRPAKGWFGIDAEAQRALGIRDDATLSFAGGRVVAAVERFAYAVIPGSSANLFVVEGADAGAVDWATRVLLENSSGIWDRPNISMAFHQLVQSMLYHRHVYCYLQFSDTKPSVLERIDWLAPETLKRRRRGGQLVLEQYVRPEATQGDGPYWCEFVESEVFQLHWPLSVPAGKESPTEAAAKAGLPEDRLMGRATLPLEAQNEEDETFVTFARARLGKYSDAIWQAQLVASKVGDLLYNVPTEPITQYFEIDRIVRMRVAACRVRDYLLHEFNAQVLARWTARNKGWGSLELVLVPIVLTAADWEEIGSEFAAGRLSYDDVVDLIRADQAAPGAIDLG